MQSYVTDKNLISSLGTEKVKRDVSCVSRFSITGVFVVNSFVRSLGTVSGLIYPVCAAIPVYVISCIASSEAYTNKSRKRSPPRRPFSIVTAILSFMSKVVLTEIII